MKEWKGIIIAVIAGLCALLSVNIAVTGFVSYKQTTSGGITATGSATQDFVSDLIVWRGSFSAYGDTTKEAYRDIKSQSDVIKKYLVDKGIAEEELVFSSVSIRQLYSRQYNDEGTVIGEFADGFELTQNITVQSSQVDKVESISRDITQLIDSGVDLYSDSPQYYYTKLNELKLEMIKDATANAKERIDIIAENSNSQTGKLLNANLGVFQITAQNSSDEEYSYSGTFNTTSKIKTAAVTVKLYYSVK